MHPTIAVLMNRFPYYSILLLEFPISKTYNLLFKNNKESKPSLPKQQSERALAPNL